MADEMDKELKRILDQGEKERVRRATAKNKPGEQPDLKDAADRARLYYEEIQPLMNKLRSLSQQHGFDMLVAIDVRAGFVAVQAEIDSMRNPSMAVASDVINAQKPEDLKKAMARMAMVGLMHEFMRDDEGKNDQGDSKNKAGD